MLGYGVGFTERSETRQNLPVAPSLFLVSVFFLYESVERPSTDAVGISPVEPQTTVPLASDGVEKVLLGDFPRIGMLSGGRTRVAMRYH